MRASLAIAALVLCVACQSESAPRRDGSSFERAIQLRAPSHSVGVEAEVAWLRQKLPGAVLADGGKNASGEDVVYLSHRTHAQANGIFSIYTMQLTDGRVVDVYFDQSSYFGK